MKKYVKRTYILLLALLGHFVGCNVDNMNTDPNSFYETEPETLIIYVEKALANQLSTPNVNLNNFRLVMQYWQETTYLEESRYDFDKRKVYDNVWERYNIGVINNIKQAKKIVNERSTGDAISKNRIAILELLECFTFQELVDTFGNIPYTQAHDIDNYPLPKYDDAMEIYTDLISRVKTAVSDLDTSKPSWDEADIIYGGDVSKWQKFGNSLLLRLGIALSDVNPSLATTTINDAIIGGIFTSNDDNALFAYETSSPNYSALYANLVASGRNDYVACSSIIDHMYDSDNDIIKDPRLDKYFDKHTLSKYVGGDPGVASPFANFTHVGQILYQPNIPARIMTFSEVMFYVSEATARGIIAGDPAIVYKDAIVASFEEWELNATDVDNYLNDNNYNYSDYADWKEALGMQSWVAMYDQPDVSWKFFRRLDYPKLAPATSAVPQSKGIPTRLIYPISEQLTNDTNKKAAADAIGGDELYTRIFWDVAAP